MGQRFQVYRRDGTISQGQDYYKWLLDTERQLHMEAIKVKCIESKSRMMAARGWVWGWG